MATTTNASAKAAQQHPEDIALFNGDETRDINGDTTGDVDEATELRRLYDYIDRNKDGNRFLVS